MAALRMDWDSAIALLPSVVFTTRWTSSFLSMSTMCGRPSLTLLTRSQVTPAFSRAAAVPPVARMRKPLRLSSRPSSTAAGLSLSRTLMKAVPPAGMRIPVASIAFA